MTETLHSIFSVDLLAIVMFVTIDPISPIYFRSSINVILFFLNCTHYNLKVKPKIIHTFVYYLTLCASYILCSCLKLGPILVVTRTSRWHHLRVT